MIILVYYFILLWFSIKIEATYVNTNEFICF